MFRRACINRILFKMVDSTDFATPEEGVSCAVQFGKDGGASADATNAAVEIGSGAYYIDTTCAEADCKRLWLKVTGAGCAQMDDVIDMAPSGSPCGAAAFNQVAARDTLGESVGTVGGYTQDPTAAGYNWQLISGNGVLVGGPYKLALWSPRQGNSFPSDYTWTPGTTAIRRKVAAITSGLWAFAANAEFHPGGETSGKRTLTNSIYFKFGDEIVACLRIGPPDGARLWTLYGGDPDATPAPPYKQRACECTTWKPDHGLVVLINLDTGWATCVQGLHRFFASDAIINTDPGLTGANWSSVWGTGNEGIGGGISINGRQIDRVEWHCVEQEVGEYNTGQKMGGFELNKPDGILSFSEQPWFVLGGMAARVVTSAINCLGTSGVAAVGLYGVMTVTSTLSLVDEGQSLCNDYNASGLGQPSLLHPNSPLAALESMGAENVVICTDADVGKSGFSRPFLTVSYSGSDTVTIQTMNDGVNHHVRVSIDSGGGPADTDLDLETYTTLADLRDAIEAVDAGISTVHADDGPLDDDVLLASPGGNDYPSTYVTDMADAVDISNGETDLSVRDHGGLIDRLNALEFILSRFKHVIIATPTGRGSASFPAQDRTYSARLDTLEYRAGILELAARNANVRVIDLYAVTQDPTNTYRINDSYDYYGFFLDNTAASIGAIKDAVQTAVLSWDPPVKDRRAAYGARASADWLTARPQGQTAGTWGGDQEVVKAAAANSRDFDRDTKVLSVKADDGTTELFTLTADDADEPTEMSAS